MECVFAAISMFFGLISVVCLFFSSKAKHVMFALVTGCVAGLFFYFAANYSPYESSNPNMELYANPYTETYSNHQLNDNTPVDPAPSNHDNAIYDEPDVDEDIYDRHGDRHEVSFKGSGKCHIDGHNCTGAVDENGDKWCDVCLKNGHECHLVRH